MALATNIVAKLNTALYQGTEITLGTAALFNAAGGVWIEPQVKDFTLPTTSIDIQSSGKASTGIYTESDVQYRSRPDLRVYTFEVTYALTLNSFAFNLGPWLNDATAPYVLNGASTQPLKTDGSASTFSRTFVFKNAAGNGTDDIIAKGCFCTDWEISQDLSSPGADEIKATWMTAYKPDESTTLVPDALSTDTAAIVTMKDMTVQIDTGTAYDLLPFKFSLKGSRTLERVGSKGSSSAENPYHIAQTNNYEITGSVTVRRDSNTALLNTALSDPTSYFPTTVSIAHGTYPTYVINGILTGDPINEEDNIFTHDIGFRGLADHTNSATAIMTITLA